MRWRFDRFGTALVVAFVAGVPLTAPIEPVWTRIAAIFVVMLLAFAAVYTCFTERDDG